MDINQLRNQKLLVLGLGQEGLSTLTFLRKYFPDKKIGVADQVSWSKLGRSVKKVIQADQQLKFYLGRDYLKGVSRYDWIFKSPGISPFQPELILARRSGKISSNTHLFFKLCQGRTVGITGTKGKSTTASLIAKILHTGGLDVHLVGNIGKPPLDALENDRESALFVIELSSHQLFDLDQSPQVAVLLNVYREHLDYYPSFEVYLSAKKKIIAHQTKKDWLVYCQSDPVVRTMITESRAKQIPFGLKLSGRHGCWRRENNLVCCSNGREEKIIQVQDVPLRGEFNLLNVMAAIVVAKIFKLDNQVIGEGIRQFKPLPHRLEYLGASQGIDYYNDSIATIPEATVVALQALAGRKVILLVGGFERGQDYHNLAQLILKQRLKKLILLPSTGKRLWRELTQLNKKKDTLPDHAFVGSMREAVRKAKQVATTGDAILLSPAGASYDLFKNFQDRGNQFRREAINVND